MLLRASNIRPFMVQVVQESENNKGPVRAPTIQQRPQPLGYLPLPVDQNLELLILSVNTFQDLIAVNLD